jgi:CBS domain-containing protein
VANKPVQDPGPAAADRVTVESVGGPAVLVRETTTLREVASLMLERQVDNVVVVDLDGVVRGIVRDHDLTLNARNLRLAALKVPRLSGHWVTALDEAEAACVAAETMTAEEIMESCLTTVDQSEPIGTAVNRMLRRDAEYALVMRESEVVGVLSQRDLLRFVAGQRESAPVSVPLDVTVQQPAAHLAARPRWPVPGWLAQAWR